MLAKFLKSLPAVAIAFGVFAFVTFFFPAVRMHFQYFEPTDVLELVSAYNGWGVVFGVKNGEFQFSFMNFLTYLLPLIGCAFVFLKEWTNNKLFAYCSIIVFLLAGVFFLLIKNFSVISFEYDDKKYFLDHLKLGAGAIFGSISCFIAALCTFADYYFNKL
jgi:hypothetical protein